MDFPVELSSEILKKAEKLKVFAEDIEEKFVRGGGAGGQKINKTNSCVWLKHLPTGFEVKVQRHRERERNRMSAYKLLVIKIETAVLGDKSDAAKKIHKIRKQKMRRSKKAKEKILEAKKQQSEKKVLRKKVGV